jgi:hypothetical protein
MRLTPLQQVLECVDLSALSAGDLSPSKADGASGGFHVPLNAALLRRQVAKAVKAVTGHRTPNLCRSRENLRPCITDMKEVRALTRFNLVHSLAFDAGGISVR